VCEACGQPIADDRLEALPAARFCLNDQHLAESERGRPQTQ
jgi:RNA polymerase-binding transcription factor DksA